MGNAWDLYDSRVKARGSTRRDVSMNKGIRTLDRMFPSSLSYHSADMDGEECQLAIINSDNLNMKTVISMPGEDIRHGAYVKWSDYTWLVIERDANNELYTRAIMQQCNYLLRWVAVVNDQPHIFEQWCIVEDGTKLFFIIVSA